MKTNNQQAAMADRISMVIDAGTLMLSLLHPVMIVFALAVFIFRRWPLTCEGVLDLLHVEEIHPWMLLLLPGARALIAADDDDEEEPEAEEEAGPPVPPRAPPRVSANLVERLLEGLHLLFIGHTGGGKTTLMHCVAVTWAQMGRKVVVWDPDAAPGLWDGCEVYGGGDDWEECAASLIVLSHTLRTRRQARRQGQRRFEPLYIVWDEVQDIVKHVNGAREFYEDIARRGRKLNLHMVLGVQDKLVKTLKLEGQSDLRKNFDVVEVYLDGKVRRAHYTEHDGDRTEDYMVPQLQNLDDLITQAPDTSLIPDKLLAKNASLLQNMLSDVPPQAPPPATTAATTPSQAEFLKTFCYVDPGAKVQAGILYDTYKSWCGMNQVEPVTQTAFGMKMTELQYEKKRTAKGLFFYHGIGLLQSNAVGGNDGD